MADMPDNQQPPMTEPESPTPTPKQPATAATPADKKAGEKTPGKKTPRKEAGKQKAPSLVPALLLVILGAAAGGGGLWYWQLQQQEAWESRLLALEEQKPEAFDSSSLERQVSQLQATLKERDATLAQVESTLANRADARQVERLTEQVGQLQAHWQTLDGEVGNRWKWWEAEFLLKLATHRAAIGQSGAETLQLARAAEALLEEIDSPDLLATRRALRAEIDSLQQVEPVARQALYLELASVQDAIADLPLAPRYQYRPSATPTPEAEAAEGVWETMKASMRRALKALSSYVRIRQHDQPVEPLLPPEYTHYLHEHLRLTLAQAQWALLEEEPGIYRDSLQKAQQWMTTYLSESEQSRQLQGQLQALQERTLVAEPVAMGEALRLLQAQLKQREARR